MIRLGLKRINAFPDRETSRCGCHSTQDYTRVLQAFIFFSELRSSRRIILADGTRAHQHIQRIEGTPLMHQEVTPLHDATPHQESKKKMERLCPALQQQAKGATKWGQLPQPTHQLQTRQLTKPNLCGSFRSFSHHLFPQNSSRSMPTTRIRRRNSYFFFDLHGYSIPYFFTVHVRCIFWERLSEFEFCKKT